MLEPLCGNKNVSRILLFLFVNGRCYGTQLHKSLKTSLTPLQKALNRLERDGVITSYNEGKTRLYQFNPAFPLIEELEQLLKKAYTLLPTHQKRDYYVVKDKKSGLTPQENQTKILLAFWKRLLTVEKLKMQANSRAKEEKGWNKKGWAEVVIVKEADERLLFHEKGHWQSREGLPEVSFSNVFRWTLDKKAGVISLEHLRRGMDHPILLFHLAPSSKNTLTSIDSHLCAGDTYFGQLSTDNYGLHLSCRVIGPKKNEELNYYYSM